MSDDLKRLRDAIDGVDDGILEALNRRAKLAREIGGLKAGQAYRPEREAQVLTRIKEKNQGPLSSETVALLFREIMSACLALERPVTVAYLGPRGTFSERAALKHFGIAAEAMASASIDEVFRAVESGAADFGVIRWRTPPRAQWAARSTSCRRRPSRFAARSSCASTTT